MMVLAPDSIEGIDAKQLPSGLRLSLLKKQGRPVVGAQVTFVARLSPLPSPVEPGGFDYGRSLWLDGVGGTAPASDHAADILRALLSLGYSEREATIAAKQLPADASVSDGIKQALKLLARN